MKHPCTCDGLRAEGQHDTDCPRYCKEVNNDRTICICKGLRRNRGNLRRRGCFMDGKTKTRRSLFRFHSIASVTIGCNVPSMLNTIWMLQCTKRLL